MTQAASFFFFSAATVLKKLSSVARLLEFAKTAGEFLGRTGRTGRTGCFGVDGGNVESAWTGDCRGSF